MVNENNLFYRGFEGEPEISFAFSTNNESYSFNMWIGYFDVILRSMLDYESHEKIFLRTYSMYEGWYDNSPWEINDINEVVCLFKNFDINKIPVQVKQQSGSLIDQIPALLKALNEFLEAARNSNEKVYILYD